MSVLVDTSIWIRFLMNRTSVADELERLLRDNDVSGHEFVYGELLIGDRSGRERLLNDYRLIDQVDTVSHEDVELFVRHRRLNGRGIGWIDAHLLAAALVSGVSLWTADRALGQIAAEFGVGYVPA